MIKNQITPIRLFVSNGASSEEQNIKAIFVMTSALMLEADRKITRRKSRSVFRDLDKALAGFAKVVDKNFVKFDGLLE